MLSNPWVGYVQRTYQQIKDKVITDLASRVPEITDHTESNLYIKIISIVSGIAEMLGYYIDNKGREAFLSVTRLFESAVKIANMLDYNVKISNPATVDLTFSLENTSVSDVTIPQYTEVSGANYDYTFITNEVLIISAGNLEGTVGAQQKSAVTAVTVGSSDGEINQSVILDISNVALDSIVATIDSEVWSSVDSLAYSTSTDKHFVVSVNEDREIYILFGDDINGAIPLNGADIIIDYFETVGSEANDVTSGTLNVINSSITVPSEAGELNVNNLGSASGGTDIETLAELQSRVPKSLRTLNRALSKLDYKDLADLYVGVLKSEVNHECGQPTAIYVVPTGGGIASDSLLSDIETYFADKKAINMLVTAKSAGQLNVDVTVDVTVESNYQNSTIQADCVTALNEFLSWDNKEIGGDVYLSNFYQAIESIEGVKHSMFNSIILNSYPRPVNTVTSTINLTVVPNYSNNTTYKYNAIFTSSTEFQLTRNEVLLGTYDVGVPIVLTEGTITITGTYITSETWEFYLYKNLITNGSVSIDEYSVPIANIISVNVTGGY